MRVRTVQGACNVIGNGQAVLLDQGVLLAGNTTAKPARGAGGGGAGEKHDMLGKTLVKTLGGKHDRPTMSPHCSRAPPVHQHQFVRSHQRRPGKGVPYLQHPPC